MKTDKIDNHVLKQYFSETDRLEKDLSPRIMECIRKKALTVSPARMPVAILWGIVTLLLASLSYALYHLDKDYLTFMEEIKLPALPQPESLVISPILVTAALAIVSAVWLVILLEKKLLRS